jgi:hypothetical protein
MLVVFFGLTDVIEERGVEERQDAAYDPTSLVARSVRTDCEPIGHVPIVRTGIHVRRYRSAERVLSAALAVHNPCITRAVHDTTDEAEAAWLSQT